jgi:hypothetical protein
MFTEQVETTPAYTPPKDVPGMVEKGNIDLGGRPIIKNKDDTISSEKSFSIEDKGKEVLIPLIVGGKELTKEQAIAHYRNTGEHMGKFENAKSADAYAEQVHNRPMEGLWPIDLSPEQQSKIHLPADDHFIDIFSALELDDNKKTVAACMSGQ